MNKHPLYIWYYTHTYSLLRFFSRYARRGYFKEGGFIVLLWDFYWPTWVTAVTRRGVTGRDGLSNPNQGRVLLLNDASHGLSVINSMFEHRCP